MTQDDAKEMGPFALSLLVDNPGTLTEINLNLVSRLAFHPAKGQRPGLHQTMNKPFDRLVTAAELMVRHQVLINTLSREIAVHRQLDSLPPFFTQAFAASRWGAERNGRN